MPRQVVGAIGVLSVVFSALVTIPVSVGLLRLAPEHRAYTQALWRWFEVGQFRPEIALYLDPLSLVMMVIITGVGALIHIYSAEYMIDDEGYSRFFAYMNLFVASMLVLVLADNMVLLYAGWEGVGLCSYLLIGFWYRDPANARAAVKAFIVTRIGDAGMAVGLLLLWATLGTLNIQEMTRTALNTWTAGSTLAIVAAALLLMGAVGKQGEDYLNSAFYFHLDTHGKGIREEYDKVHLVPYGEMVPFRSLFPFIKRMVEARGGGEYLPGKGFPVFEVDGFRFGVLICFESTLAPLAREYAKAGADFTIVITNDAWFQKSTAPFQHAIQSAFRAIETGMPVVRATNTGWTSAFSANGKLLAGMPIYTRDTLIVDIHPGRHDTLYARWGDLPIQLALGLTLGYFIALLMTDREESLH